MKTILGYLSGIGFQELLIVLFGMLFCIGIFLALRAVALWYWKIDRIVVNQQTQIQLLQDLIHSVKASNKTEVM